MAKSTSKNHKGQTTNGELPLTRQMAKANLLNILISLQIKKK